MSVCVEQETMALSEEEQKKLKSDKYGAVEEIRCGPDPTNKESPHGLTRQGLVVVVLLVHVSRSPVLTSASG